MSSLFSSWSSQFKSSESGESQDEKLQRRLGIRYIAPRIVILAKGLPKSKSVSKSMMLPMNVKFNSQSQQERYLAEVADYLKKKHQGRFMVWNLSDVNYDTTSFDNQVIQFTFPGQPTPPLELLHQICKSIQSWLAAESKNVALVHCSSGRGRTYMTAAAHAYYTKEQSTMDSAIESLADPSASSSTPSPASLLVPTQRRYLHYYQRYLSQGLPKETRKLGLVKVVCHGIPRYNAKPSDARSCRPYVQVFQKGQLIHTTTGPEDSHYELSPQDLRLYDSRDTKMEFSIGCNVTGDVSVRMRHFHSLKKRITMARFGFHTSFIDEKGEGDSFTLALSREDIDVACSSKRFDEDFKMELVFGEVKEVPKPEPKPQNEAKESLSTVSEKGREREEDIQDLESRLHQVLEDITSDEDDAKDEKAKSETVASSSPEKEDTGFGGLLVDEDDDGEKLLAALHAELDDE